MASSMRASNSSEGSSHQEAQVDVTATFPAFAIACASGNVNDICFSHNDGETWEPYHSTGIRGQTLSVLPLGNDRLLVLYNRRYGRQGIVMALVKFTETEWTVVEEDLLYDACGFRDVPDSGASGVDELASFQFGFPTAIRLNDGNFLVTHWCVEQGVCGIRWTRLAVTW